jgi:hypothetical protein
MFAKKQWNCKSGMLVAVLMGYLIHIFVFLILTPSELQSRTIGSHDQYVSSLCDEASRIASKEFGIPEQIMLAITRTETGRRNQGATYPWPWAVNLEGRGLWFDTQAEALAFVFDHFKTGARNFDVGCFQINYRWHGAAFASIDQMFDPIANARYAASFLRSLYAKSGDWTQAVGAYHSKTKEYADQYMVKFQSSFSEIDTSSSRVFVPALQTTREPRQNRFPLIQDGPISGLASLVPLPNAVGVTPVINLQSVPEG